MLGPGHLRVCHGNSPSFKTVNHWTSHEPWLPQPGAFGRVFPTFLESVFGGAQSAYRRYVYVTTVGSGSQEMPHMGLSKNSVPHCTQWFCWSLSLWKMAISLGIYPIFRNATHGLLEKVRTPASALDNFSEVFEGLLKRTSAMSAGGFARSLQPNFFRQHD